MSKVVHDPLNQGLDVKKPPKTCYTQNGYALDEIVSALQKFIRRGETKAALHVALEMQESKGESNPCGFAAYCFRRLMVIACEDIADPLAPVVVQSLYDSYGVLTGRFKKKPTSAVECLAQAVIYLAEAPCNRRCDDLLMTVLKERHEGWLMPIPDFALDSHTFRGKHKLSRRGLRYFMECSGRIENIQGGNPWAKLVGDKVNTDRYEPEELPDSEYQPVHVPEKALPSTHIFAGTARGLAEVIGEVRYVTSRPDHGDQTSLPIECGPLKTED